MGFSTTEIPKASARKFYNVNKVESASEVNWFYKLPRYNDIKKVFETDKTPKTVIFEIQEYPVVFIEVLKY